MGCCQESTREVSKQEGTEFARQHGCLFVETSAKMNVAVQQAFEELILKIMDTPSLMASGHGGLKLGAAGASKGSGSCC